MRQVAKLVDDHVTEHRGGGEQQPPAQRHRTVAGAAAPLRARIADPQTLPVQTQPVRLGIEQGLGVQPRLADQRELERAGQLRGGGGAGREHLDAFGGEAHLRPRDARALPGEGAFLAAQRHAVAAVPTQRCRASRCAVALARELRHHPLHPAGKEGARLGLARARRDRQQHLARGPDADADVASPGIAALDDGERKLHHSLR